MALLSEDLVSEELDEETRQVVKELSYPPPHDLYPSFKQYQQIYKCRYFQKNRSLFRKEVICESEPLENLSVSEIKENNFNGIHENTEWQG